MITISTDSKITRDGQEIGQIIGDTAWLKEEQSGVIKGQIKKAADVNILKFEVMEPEPETKPDLGIVAGLAQVSRLTTFPIEAEWGQPGTPYFQRCYVNTYGPGAYADFMAARG